MKKRALAVMLAGVMVLGAQTGVWAASDTSDQKEGELTLLMTNSWIDESGASSEEFLKVIKQYNMKKRIRELRLPYRVLLSRILKNLSRLLLWQAEVQIL